MTTRILLTGLLNVLLLLPIFGQEKEARIYTIDEIPNVYEQDSTQFVSDPEGYFSAGERATINRKFDELNAHNGVQAVLVVVPAVPNDDELSFSTKLFEKWGIGDADEDSGLLILFLTDTRHRNIRFEVGYGLEGVLTDARSDRFIRDYLVPAVLDGNAADGFVSMLTDLDALLQEEYEYIGTSSEEQPVTEEDVSFLKVLMWWVIASIIYALIVIAYYETRKRRQGEHSLASIKEVLRFRETSNYSQLGIFSFALMPSVVLLWPYLNRREERNRHKMGDCPKCGTKQSVRQMRYPDNKPYLTQGEETEALFNSRHHTVLKCSHCDYLEKVSVTNPETTLTVCPSCGARTLRKVRTTRISNNYVTDHYFCENCGHDERRRRRQSNGSAPLITGGGIGGAIGGSFGGGGFGGGGFSGGSFGGGMSGGGGASVSF